MTDRDEALHYLLNKLKSEDGWSSSNLTWNDEKLAVISDQFSSFDGVVKAKVLLSFMSMSPRTITQVVLRAVHYLVNRFCSKLYVYTLRSTHAHTHAHTHMNYSHVHILYTHLSCDINTHTHTHTVLS